MNEDVHEEKYVSYSQYNFVSFAEVLVAFKQYFGPGTVQTLHFSGISDRKLVHTHNRTEF